MMNRILCIFFLKANPFTKKILFISKIIAAELLLLIEVITYKIKTLNFNIN